MSVFNNGKNNIITNQSNKEQPSILASLKNFITPKSNNPSLSEIKTATLSQSKIPSKIPSISKSLSSLKTTIKKPSNSFVEEIEDNIATPVASFASASSTGITSGSRSWQFWIGVIFVLALLGFNIFTYAGEIIEFIKKLFLPMLSLFGYTVGETSKMTINTAAKGSTEIIDSTANIATSGINVLENALTNRSDTALINIEKNITNKSKSTPIPDEADSRTQTNRAIGKKGYCYVGQENNIRSCVKVGENDTCMSGDIFPTHDLCINPNLRR